MKIVVKIQEWCTSGLMLEERYHFKWRHISKSILHFENLYRKLIITKVYAYVNELIHQDY